MNDPNSIDHNLFWNIFKFCILPNFKKHISLNRSHGHCRIPYIIAITGSVAVGKSTTANLMKILLRCWLKGQKIEVIATDNFLYPNTILNRLGIMQKKGFPQSYNNLLFRKFLYDIKSGANKLCIPIYSHIFYDISPNEVQIVESPDLIILEGLNIFYDIYLYELQKSSFNFFDFVIYIDAEEYFLKSWYIGRFLNFCRKSANYPGSYFHYLSKLRRSEIIQIANKLWMEINKINLHENIFPLKRVANLIVTKGKDHKIVSINFSKRYFTF
ncbi:type I pantothenate kinase [Candidatus Riesia pediculicola]|uniref:type I pantothenate kinase n=1 Tax=Candidatus Riesia pediculicola TaxID=401619 RepID=UPI0009E2E606|nr:type I pantothenate kinase [Candidatus Riesia pediculicola]